MEHKLKAISNNVNNNDTVVNLIPEDDGKLNLNDTSHTCERQVPVLFVTNRGNQLRVYNKNWPRNYQVTFCDLERWVSVITYKYIMNIIWYFNPLSTRIYDLIN